MCGDDNYIEIPTWVQEKINKLYEEGMIQPIRCLESLGIHEYCEHTRPSLKFSDFGLIDGE